MAHTANEPTYKADRRREQRHITLLRAGTLHLPGGGQELCLVMNISSGGLKAKVYTRLAVGLCVEVELRPRERLIASVTWSEGVNHGFAFDHPLDISELLTTPWVAERHHRSRLPRLPVNTRCRIRLGSRMHTARLTNVSPGGVGLQTESELPRQAELVLLLPDLPPLRAVVRWTCGSAAGLSFMEPLNLETLARWMIDRRREPPTVARQA